MEKEIKLQTEESLLLDAWLDVAEAMLDCGAEMRRIERALSLLGSSVNVKRINAFSINSYISVTCTFEDGTILTQSRRIVSNPSTDLARLEALNSLSRKACSEHFSPEVLKQEVAGLNVPASKCMYLAGGFLAAFAFALFFGSTFPEALISGAAGIVVCLLSGFISRFLPNAVFSNFISAFLTGLMIYPLCRLVPSLSPARILIGDVMLLIPGLAITNSTRDIIVGDTISGTMRFVESILWAGALALGFVAAMMITGGAV